MCAESWDLILSDHAPWEGIAHRGRERCRERDIDGELGAEYPGQTGLAGGGREAHRATDIIVIGEGERGEPEVARARDERLGIARAIE